MKNSYRAGYHLQNRLGAVFLEQGQLAWRFWKGLSGASTYHATIQRSRDSVLAGNGDIEIGLGRADLFDDSYQAVEATHSIQLVAMAELGRIQ